MTRAPALPPRVRAALEALPVRAGSRVLEVGCGHGIALEAVAAQLWTGYVVGVDRSAKMTGLAEARLREAGLSARARVVTGDVARVDVGDGRFDVVFAVNVAAFARDADVVARLRTLLAPRGSVVLVFEAPSAAHVRDFREGASEKLRGAGFAVEVHDLGAMVRLVARRALGHAYRPPTQGGRPREFEVSFRRPRRLGR